MQVNVVWRSQPRDSKTTQYQPTENQNKAPNQNNVPTTLVRLLSIPKPQHLCKQFRKGSISFINLFRNGKF